MRVREIVIVTFVLALLTCAPTASAAVTLPPDYVDEPITHREPTAYG